MTTPLRNKLINSYKDEMITFLNNHPEYFDEAIELALGDDQPFAWRAAWLLWSCVKENDRRIINHIDQIIENIPGKKDGHQRELIKILLIMDLNEEQEGMLFDICMDLWEGLNKNPSVRITAFKFIVKMAAKYPELEKEVVFLTQDHYIETLSPGIKNSINKIINK